MAALMPATVSKPQHMPWAMQLAVIKATSGPGIGMRTTVTATKAR